MKKAAAIVGFCGSRALSAQAAADVARVVASVVASGRGVAVGCAAGVDALVRAACPSARVFRASDFGVGRASFARRSAAMCAAVAASGAGCGLVAFVAAPCPLGLSPSPSASRCFAGHGSGSWASVALAVGLGVPVVVFPCGGGSSSWLPSWWGGSWSAAASCGVWASGFRFAPALPLFPV